MVSIKVLAERLGYNRAHVSRVINGKTPVSKKFAERCGTVLGVSAGEIIERQTGVSALAQTKIARPVQIVREIRAAEIAAWAGDLAARSRLAVLLRRLVHETDPTVTYVDFPGNDQSQTPGWDGEVESGTGRLYIPCGSSRWEFGVGDPANKANGDFNQRVKTINADDRRLMTFVFVSPRIWLGKKKWAEDKRAENEFADVRVLDADDLEQWLELAPSTQVWMSREIGIPTGAMESLEGIWRRWQVDRADCLTPCLFREACRSANPKLLTWLKDPTECLTLTADSALEAAALIAALGNSHPLRLDLVSGEYAVEAAASGDKAEGFDDEEPSKPEVREALGAVEATLDRLVGIFKAEDVKSNINACKSILPIMPIIMTTEAEAALAEAAPDLPYIRTVGRGAPKTNSALTLDPLSYSAFFEALRAASLNDAEIERLDVDSGRSLTILRRRVSSCPAVARPEWVGSQVASILGGLAFAGRFNAANPDDRSAIELICDRPFAEMETAITSLVALDDSPIWMAGNQIGVKSQLDIFYAIGANLTVGDAQRFFDVASQVLPERDPALDLPVEDRAYAAIHGKKRDFSGGLRNGIAHGALALTVTGERVCLDPVVDCIAEQSCELAKTLVSPWEGDTLKSVNDILPAVAEMQPEIFLKALEDDLNTTQNIEELLTPIDRCIFGAHNYRTGLLWALETLAWSPQYYARTASILARLSQTEIDDNWMNKPTNSLRTLFRSWIPQTAVDLAGRKKVFCQLWNIFPSVAWDIAIAEISRGPAMAMRNATPCFRDYAHGIAPVTNHDVSEFRRFCFQLCLNKAEPSAETLGDLLGLLGHMDKADEATLWNKAMAWADTASDEERLSLRRTLHQHTRSRFSARRKREDGEAGYDEAKADELHETLRPRDPVSDLLWLFKSHWIDFGMKEDLDGDWEARDERIRQLRMGKLNKLVDTNGRSAVMDLIDRCESPAVVGDIYALTSPELDESTALIAELFKSVNEDALRGFLRGFMHRYSVELCKLVVRLGGEDRKRLVEFMAIEAPFAAETWDHVDTCAELRDVYWINVSPVWAKDAAEAARAARAFLKIGRASAAFEVLSQEFAKVEAPLLADVLEAMTDDPGTNTNLIMYRYNLEEAFKVLSVSDLISFERMLALEFRYLRRLQETSYGIPSVEEAVENDPAPILQALSFVHKRDDDLDDPDGFGSVEDTRPDFKDKMWQFLNDWSFLPGQSKSTPEQKTATFGNWIDRALELGSELGRARITALTIGQFTGRSAPKEGELWPASWVADALEPRIDERMAEGFYMGRYNARGCHGFTSGAQEKCLAEAYARAADHYRITHPNLAGALDTLKQSYLDESKENVRRGEAMKRIGR